MVGQGKGAKLLNPHSEKSKSSSVPKIINEDAAMKKRSKVKKKCHLKQSQTNRCHGKEPVDETARNNDGADSMEDLLSSNSLKEKKTSSIIGTLKSFSPSSISSINSLSNENKEEMKRLAAEKRRREANTGATDILRQADILREFERKNDIFYMRVKKWRTS